MRRGTERGQPSGNKGADWEGRLSVRCYNRLSNSSYSACEPIQNQKI